MTSSRRWFLQSALALSGVAFGLPRDLFGDLEAAGINAPDAPGELLGTLPFLFEGRAALDVAFGSGLDGRLYTNLSTLDSDSLVTPADRFYIRTRYPDRLTARAPWQVAIRGLVTRPASIAADELSRDAVSCGTHVMECAGNGAFANFGMLSAAEWAGVPVAHLLDRAQPVDRAARVLISGADDHGRPSETSTAGASWIFTIGELRETGAFLATRMNGKPLLPDHGSPVRLIVPGCYGCACIKWVNEIVVVDEIVGSTAHMKEFAGRTHQDGIPALAREFKPARMELGALPVRIEKRRLDGGIIYWIVGVVWGGARLPTTLTIDFNGRSGGRIDVPPGPGGPTTWRLWTYLWRPSGPGRFLIALNADPELHSLRLAGGAYARAVRIGEV